MGVRAKKISTQNEPFRRRPILTTEGPEWAMRLQVMAERDSGGYRDDPDTHLLSATGSGDMRAFRRLHQRYRPKVYRFALRLLRRHDQADEVAGDTMLAVWRGAESFRGAGQPSTWIFGIAYRVAMNMGRRRARDGLHDELDDQLAAASTDVGGLPAAFLKEQIAAALRALPIEQRATIELAYVYGYRLTEIAEITGCPVGTVKTRMFHARNKLRSILGGEG
ncbi:MAG: RNA polymerase sigma factor [Pseudomonadota bacterium]